MATLNELLSRVRNELGDRLLPFRDTLRGTGTVAQYELSANNLTTTGLTVFTITGTTQTPLVAPADYVVDLLNGILTLTVPLPLDTLLLVSGSSYGLFADDELAGYLSDAVSQHTRGRTISTRYRDSHGFVKYDQVAVSLSTLPPEEDIMVVVLAATEAMWALATDASTDINVQTSDGTTVDRGQRFAQLQSQIGLLESRYQMLCEKLGVGMFAIEVSNLRRVSRTTNRLVPLFREQEYDDYALPVRILPPVGPGHQDDDESGVPSQTTYGWY
jgi:hypothetical protein